MEVIKLESDESDREPETQAQPYTFLIITNNDNHDVEENESQDRINETDSQEKIDFRDKADQIEYDIDQFESQDKTNRADSAKDQANISVDKTKKQTNDHSDNEDENTESLTLSFENINDCPKKGLFILSIFLLF